MPDLDHVTLPSEPWEWSMSLPAEVHAATVARRVLRVLLASWNIRCILDDVELVTSELVTNVVRHGAFPAELRVQWQDACVRVAVEDAHPMPPRQRDVPTEAVDGRGLQIIDEIARDWGVDRAGGGKVVWADLLIR